MSLEPTEIENTDNNEDTESARGDLLRDMPEGLIHRNFVGGRVPEHKDAPASSSRVTFRAAEERGIG